MWLWGCLSQNIDFSGRKDKKLPLSEFHLISLFFPVHSYTSTRPHSQRTYCIMCTLKQEFKDLWIRWVVLTGAAVAIFRGQPTSIMCHLFPLASEISERATEWEREFIYRQIHPQTLKTPSSLCKHVLFTFLLILQAGVRINGPYAKDQHTLKNWFCCRLFLKFGR